MAKDSRGSMLFWVGALALCTALAATSGHAAVGRTIGSFTVSNSATATYSIPIFTPPGPRGVQPSVALVYNSGGRSGYVGKGWSLSGFSAITRCNKTVAQNGEAARVAMNNIAPDVYCLDGNQLRLQSGNYGEADSVYHTELADFSCITAVGATGFGPSSWTVERKDGRTYTYGGTTELPPILLTPS